MLESNMGESSLKIFQGNILRIDCDILILYEKKEYSIQYKRLIKHKNLIESDSCPIYNFKVSIYENTKLDFKKLFILDNIIEKESTNRPKNPNDIINGISQYLNPFVPNKCRIVVNLTENQETELFKTFIDRLTNQKKVEIVLSGFSNGIRSMLGYLNQSGHMLMNGSISSGTALNKFYEKLSCYKCGKIDPNSRLLNQSQLICQNCSSISNNLPSHLFIKNTISTIRNLCYCSKYYSITEKLKHLKDCVTALYSCIYCTFEGGQADLMNHLFHNHSAELIKNSNSILSKPNGKIPLIQCDGCGNFYQSNRICNLCLAKKSNPNSLYN